MHRLISIFIFHIFINFNAEQAGAHLDLFTLDMYAFLLMIHQCTVENDDNSSTLQNYLDKLSTWDMECNPSKCQVVQVTGSRRPLNTKYIAWPGPGDSHLCFKYLGVDISSGLSRNPHIDRFDIAGSANWTLDFIR